MDGGGQTGKALSTAPGLREYLGSELKGRREGTAVLARIDLRIPPSGLA